MKFQPDAVQSIYEDVVADNGYRFLIGNLPDDAAYDRPLAVLVHLGSLCVPGDLDVPDGWEPDDVPAAVAQDITGFNGDVCAILGDFTDRIQPPYDKGLGNAVQRCFRYGTAMVADSSTPAFEAVADTLVERLSADRRPEVVITGAWADAEDGCCATLARCLQERGVAVRLSENAAALDNADRWTPESPVAQLA